MLPIMHAVRDESTIQSPRPLQIRPEQPTPSLQNCHAHSLKTKKHFSELATYLATFSVTYLATLLKLAKFSVTERTAGLFTPRYFRSSERKFPVGTFAPRNESSRELSLLVLPVCFLTTVRDAGAAVKVNRKNIVK